MLKTISRHALIGVAFALFARIFGFFYYGILFGETMQANMEIYRPMDAWQWPALVFQGFIEGVILSIIYSWIKANLKDPKNLSPVIFATVFAIITRVFAESYIYLAFNQYPLILSFAGILAGISGGIAIGFVLHFFECCKKQKKDTSAAKKTSSNAKKVSASASEKTIKKPVNRKKRY